MKKRLLGWIRRLRRQPGWSDPSPGELSSDSVGSEAIGGFLRRQRELRGIGLEELAALTRIPHRSLERLEAGFFDGQVDGFSRGFVRAVSEALGLDAGDAISRMFAEPESGAPEVGWRRAFRDSRLLAALAVGFSLAILLVLSGREGESSIPGIGDSEPGRIHRRNFVRELAEARSGSPPSPEFASGDPRESRVGGRSPSFSYPSAFSEGPDLFSARTPGGVD